MSLDAPLPGEKPALTSTPVTDEVEGAQFMAAMAALTGGA